MALIAQTGFPQSTPDIVLTSVDCDATVVVGDWVRMNSLGVAVKAQADTFDNSNTIGLVEKKLSSTLCNIRVLGVSDAIFTGLDVTKEYYLSDVTAGAMALTIPTAAATAVLKVGQPFSSTRFLVLKGIRMIRS